MSYDNFRKPWCRKFIFAHPVYLQGIRVKFVHEYHRVKVKVTFHGRLKTVKSRKSVSLQCKTSIGNNSASIKQSHVYVGFLDMVDRSSSSSSCSGSSGGTLVQRNNNNMSLPQPLDVERWPNSLLPGYARNTPTSLQHTLFFQLPWRPWAQWTTLHTISSKTLAARLVNCLVTAEKGRSFSSGCQSQSRF